MILIVIGLLTTVWFTPETVRANHKPDGNIQNEVNYQTVIYNGAYRVCDISSLLTTADIQNGLAIWNGNAQKTIAYGSCSSPSTNVTDTPNNGTPCGVAPPGFNYLGCGDYPTAQIPQVLGVWMEEDADGILNQPFSAQYFNNTTLSGPPALTRTDQAIDFDWGSGSPSPSVNPDNFSVRWTSTMSFQTSGTYVFTTTTDDGVTSLHRQQSDPNHRQVDPSASHYLDSNDCP